MRPSSRFRAARIIMPRGKGLGRSKYVCRFCRAIGRQGALLLLYTLKLER